MIKLYILAGIIFAIGIILTILKAKFEGGEKEKAKYQYKKKQFFLTRAEHECYDTLIAAVGNDYHIFAQVHLLTLLDNKVVGQDWLENHGVFNVENVSQKIKLAVETYGKTN